MEQHSRRLLSPEDAVAVDVEVGRAPPRQLWAKAREGRFGKDGKQGGRRGGRRGRNFEMRKPRAGDWERIKQLFRYMRSERARLLLGSALMIFGSLLGLSTPSLFGEILDLLHTGDGGQEPELRALSGALVGVIFSTACVGALQRYLFATAGERLVNNLKSKLFDAMLSREIAFFDANDSGALLSRITDDASRLRGLMTRTWPVGVALAPRLGWGCRERLRRPSGPGALGQPRRPEDATRVRPAPTAASFRPLPPHPS